VIGYQGEFPALQGGKVGFDQYLGTGFDRRGKQGGSNPEEDKKQDGYDAAEHVITFSQAVEKLLRTHRA
jgi:hypothetical protein